MFSLVLLRHMTLYVTGHAKSLCGDRELANCAEGTESKTLVACGIVLSLLTQQ